MSQLPRKRHFDDAVPLGEARQWLRDNRKKPGGICPCCQQQALEYDNRQIHATIARALCLLHREAGQGWFHINDLPMKNPGSCEIGKARYWGLVEEEQERRPDGGRAGWWRLTDKGVDFIHGRITIPKYSVIYDSRFLRHRGPQVDIHDCLRSKFNYDELLGRVSA